MFEGLILIRQATADGYIAMCNGGVCNLSYPNSKHKKGRVQGGGMICPTITCNYGELYRITVYYV